MHDDYHQNQLITYAVAYNLGRQTGREIGLSITISAKKNATSKCYKQDESCCVIHNT